jgi:uncharacterized SAM-binding protein YcdF (DUF218 family)
MDNMKNRRASYIFIVLAVWSAGYFIALEIASPSFFSFSFIWLFLGIIFFLCFLSIRRKNGNEKFVPYRWLTSAGKRIISAAAAIFILTASINLYFICTPSVSDGTEQVQYVILLGGGITRDGTLAPGAERRVQRTAEYMKVHPCVKVVVSGGKGPFAPCAESFVLASELERYGIAADRVIQEPVARDTIQNFSYSALLIAQNSGMNIRTALSRPIAVVTSDFHLARAERIARREGYVSVCGIAAETPELFIIDSYAREILAYCKLNIRIFLTHKPSQIY